MKHFSDMFLANFVKPSDAIEARDKFAVIRYTLFDSVLVLLMAASLSPASKYAVKLMLVRWQIAVHKPSGS